MSNINVDLSKVVVELRLIRLALERLSPPPETTYGQVHLQEAAQSGFKPLR